MNPFRTLGAWLARHLIEDGRPDHPAREGHIDPATIGTRVADVMMAQVESAAHAARDFCDDRRDDELQHGVFYVCTLAPNHGGDHQCYRPGDAMPMASWSPDGGGIMTTPIFDEVQRMQAAKRMASAAMPAAISADLKAVAEIGAAANAMRDAGDAAWEYALAGLLDDAEGGEQR